ncbi:SGNH/GDSL hydrolase family protein [Limosilactobacillus equigenerosi]|uniref:SGNH/GDSL hydrolase family protein n=1 Tax=Limosilactobacillus equigenerosi TaxID=417373 RepID=UPI0009E6AC7E|nr:SGNH/GDSL hydrolase family protein [Limosilactobacillus equigenerosi]
MFHGDGVDQRDNIPNQLATILGADLTNAAISGAGWGSSSRDSLSQVTNTPNRGYNLAILEFGVNNFGWPTDLETVRTIVNQTITQVKFNDFNTDVMLSLPTPDFRWGKDGTVPTLDDKNDKGWSQNDLIDMLISVAESFGCQYYDWRKNPIITYDNAPELLQEGRKGVHPTAKGARLLAQALADFITKTKLGAQEIPQFISQTSPSGVTQVVANPDYIAQQAQPAQQTKIQIKLTAINSVDELIAVFNSNMTLVYKALELTFEPQKFTELDRSARNYIINSINDLKTLLGIKYVGQTFIDSDGNVSGYDLIVPESLLIEQVIVDLNKDWKTLEQFINTVNSI